MRALFEVTYLPNWLEVGLILFHYGKTICSDFLESPWICQNFYVFLTNILRCSSSVWIRSPFFSSITAAHTSTFCIFFSLRFQYKQILFHSPSTLGIKKINKEKHWGTTNCLFTLCAFYFWMSGRKEEKTNHNVVQINSWLFLHGMCLYAFLALLAICWASIDCEFHKCHPDIHLSISIHLTRLQLQCEKFQWDIILIDAPGSST